MDCNLYPEDNQKHLIKTGLAAMAPGFLAEACGVCDGAGKYEQTYTVGCGGGYYRSYGYCDYCNGWGLRMPTGPAPKSVYDQVCNAADWL